MFKTSLAIFSSAALICAGMATPSFALSGQPSAAAAAAAAAPQDRGNRRGRGRQAPPADPAVIMAAAQAILTAADKSCVPSEANQMGQDPQGNRVFEVACTPGTGPGYILVAKAPPASPELFDCVMLASQAERTRANNPEAPVQECKLAGNQNPLGVITGYARAAGIGCNIDQGVFIGRNAGNDVYEVGCNGDDGFWIEQDPQTGGWSKTECTIINSQNATCRFTSAGEIAASFKARLAGSAADDCDVTEVRFMGANNNGRFYEAKCAAENTGYIARTNTEGAVQQIYPCATAQRVGGGCTLTPAPALTEQ